MPAATASYNGSREPSEFGTATMTCDATASWPTIREAVDLQAVRPDGLVRTIAVTGASGLYYYRARYYHPTLSRFVSEDPISLHLAVLLRSPDGGPGKVIFATLAQNPLLLNQYLYVANEPIDHGDPLGLLGPLGGMGLGAALGGIGGAGGGGLGGAAVGAAIGFGWGWTIPLVPPGPLGAAVGGFVGAAAGGTVGAIGGGVPGLVCGTVIGFAGGAVGGFIGGIPGAIAGTAIGLLPCPWSEPASGHAATGSGKSSAGSGGFSE